MACAGCGSKLGSRFFKLDSRYFHHDCFVCKTCSGSLSGGYFEVQGQFYCQSHIPNQYGTVPRPTVGGGKGTGYYDPDESTESKQCAVCYGKLKTDPYVVVEDELVHKKCFNCTGCGKTLSKVPYFYHGPGVYLCEKDDRWAKGQDDGEWNCCGCKKTITDSLMMVRGKKFHPECVKCTTKGCKEQAKAIVLDDNYCATHMPVGSEPTHRIDRKSTADVPVHRETRAIAKAEIIRIPPRIQKEEIDYGRKPLPVTTNPFASRDGAVPFVNEEPKALPYVSTRPAAFVNPGRKAGGGARRDPDPEPEAEDEPEPSPRGGGGGGGDDDDAPTPVKSRVPKSGGAKGRKAEPEPSIREKPKMSVAERAHPGENPMDLVADEEEEKPVKRGTPGAARKQLATAEDAKEKLRNRLKDEPVAKGKPHYTIPANPDGTPKTAQDLLEDRQREAEKKEKRAKEKDEQRKKEERRAKIKNMKAEEAQRKAQLTGSGAKLKKKKDEDEDSPAEED